MTYTFHFDLHQILIALVLAMFLIPLWFRRRSDARHRDAPWAVKRTWASGRIPATGASRGSIVVRWLMVVVFALPLLLVAKFLPELRAGVTQREPLAMFAIVFAALWILALVRTAPIGSGRARGIVFVMDPVPGRIGGAVSGRVELRPGDLPLGQIEATLTCLVAGLEPSPRENVFWHETRSIVATGDSFIPIAFTTPATLPSSDNVIGGSGNRWVLSISAETQRGKLMAQFDLPVFKLEGAAAAAPSAAPAA